VLYRVFSLRSDAAPDDHGALSVARERQAAGRHDNPDRFGALYASRSPESAVAERIQAFRGRELTDEALRRADGRRLALGAIDDDELSDQLVDLDDPRQLARRRLRPSQVATSDRSVTQPIAAALFDEGIPGFLWWSALEASWANATLFLERAAPMLRLDGDPEVLFLEHPAVIRAAERLGIRPARRPRPPRARGGGATRPR
jgi:RES domain-containing protein